MYLLFLLTRESSRAVKRIYKVDLDGTKTLNIGYLYLAFGSTSLLFNNSPGGKPFTNSWTWVFAYVQHALGWLLTEVQDKLGSKEEEGILFPH